MVMGYTLLGQLPTILGLCLFVAIVATLSRMYGDSEMVIWFSSGKGLASFLAPMVRFAWPVLLVIALLSIFVWPWSNQQIQDMKDRFERRSDIDRIAPGQFQESANGSRVFFIDRDTPDNRSGPESQIFHRAPPQALPLTRSTAPRKSGFFAYNCIPNLRQDWTEAP